MRKLRVLRPPGLRIHTRLVQSRSSLWSSDYLRHKDNGPKSPHPWYFPWDVFQLLFHPLPQQRPQARQAHFELRCTLLGAGRTGLAPPPDSPPPVTWHTGSWNSSKSSSPFPSGPSQHSLRHSALLPGLDNSFSCLEIHPHLLPDPLIISVPSALCKHNSSLHHRLPSHVSGTQQALNGC